MFIPAEHTGRITAGIGAYDGPLAIAEIAGRDSVAAAVAAVRERGFATLLPVSVATSTEFGDESAPERAAEHLRDLLEGTAHVLPHVRLGAPRLWAALNGRFAGVVADRFGLFSPCLACHLSLHLARVPLARALGGVAVISGERDTHDGRLKLSQTTQGIDASARVLARGGVELLEPIRHIRDAARIEALVGPSWTADGRQLCCVHSGNYLDLDGQPSYDELAYMRYLHAFLEPAGSAIIDAWIAGAAEPDYEEIVGGVLDGPGAA
ncbi:MAG: hypothetical protein Q7W30_06830 [Coriobacteriia bacterium]|nr:hypothetical protein [Coriobacteriia bacterium]